VAKPSHISCRFSRKIISGLELPFLAVLYMHFLLASSGVIGYERSGCTWGRSGGLRRSVKRFGESGTRLLPCRRGRLSVDRIGVEAERRRILLEGAKGKVKFEAFGEEMLEKKVSLSGNSGRIYLPPDWVGHQVKIIRID
jgi:putative transposon-encoded protein